MNETHQTEGPRAGRIDWGRFAAAVQGASGDKQIRDALRQSLPAGMSVTDEQADSLVMRYAAARHAASAWVTAQRRVEASAADYAALLERTRKRVAASEQVRPVPVPEPAAGALMASRPAPHQEAQPETQTGSALTPAMLTGLAVGAVLPVVGPAVRRVGAARAAAAAARPSAAEVRAAEAAGFVIPGHLAQGQGLAGRAAASFAGRARTEAGASMANQAVVQKAAREAMATASPEVRRAVDAATSFGLVDASRLAPVPDMPERLAAAARVAQAFPRAMQSVPDAAPVGRVELLALLAGSPVSAARLAARAHILAKARERAKGGGLLADAVRSGDSASVNDQVLRGLLD
ncbi:MAG: hypothetical protein L6Q74_09010 [Sphaerotilus natans subsp. sulfidivorans]|uniref:hypothetical protein n=1 Tax=Sphaerotilus sulfidivorans TaxID=639200 RepID=UPI0023544745|nr:hypothetical protein [Sphaerotilus sulfidivorans]MCK6402026.1 hypothetical protein [Sphaerotilus sulfidivorans]